MRILVVGGTRFIGRYVVEQLHQLGHDLTIFHRGQTKSNLRGGVKELLGDRKKLGDFSSEFKKFRPEVVVDMIPLSEADAAAAAEVFSGIAKRMVAISSMDVYRAYGRFTKTEPGEPDPVPLTEDSPLRESFFPYRGKIGWAHDYEKILVEKVVMEESRLPGTVLRLPMVYGPHDYQHRLFEYLKRMDDRRPAIFAESGLPQWRWTRGYVENVASAIALAATDERAANRIYNVGETETLLLGEWIDAIGKVAGWNIPLIGVEKNELPRHLVSNCDPNQDLMADTWRIRRELNYKEPFPQMVALQRTIAWERANPPEKVDPAQFDYKVEDALWKKFEDLCSPSSKP